MAIDGGVEVVEKAFPAELGGLIGDFELVDEKLVYPCPAAESTREVQFDQRLILLQKLKSTSGSQFLEVRIFTVL